MTLKKVGRTTVLASAALFATMLGARPTRAIPPDSDALPPDIEALYDAGQYRRAADALQAAVARNSTDTSLYYWLGRSLYEIRDFGHSISSFERAIALDPDRSEYHDWLGRACGRKADESSRSNMAAALSLARRTRHEFEAAVRLDQTNTDAQRDLIAFMENAPGNLGGGEDRAREQIRSLSAVDPVEGALALAELYAVHKRFEQASEEYQKILEGAPNRISVYLEVADYYRDREDSGPMEEAVEAAGKMAPSDRRLPYYRGVALALEKKNAAAAENELRTYIHTVPDNSEVPAHSSAYEWLGKVYESEEKPDLAAEQYQVALALDPQNKAVREALKRLQKK